MKIVDAQDKSPIPNARLILANEVLYTNEDGMVLIPNQISAIEIFNSGYESKKITHIDPVIELKPLYKEIEEVKIINVNIKNIVIDVFKNYRKRYFDKPSLYNIIYRQKNTSDGNLSLLMLAEAKLWSKSNMYNYKNTLQENYDEFVQIELNNIRYFKSKEAENNIIQGSSLDQSKDFVGNIFFNYELRRFTSYLESKDIKYSANVISENGDEQTIQFKASSPSGINVSGIIIYNTLDKVILHYELNYEQSKWPSYKKQTKDGLEYDFKPGDGVVVFDFYKKNKKYIPSQANMKGDCYITYDNIKSVKTFEREIIFQTFDETDSKGFENKIDFKKSLWENIPNQEQKDSKILLSKEEQDFIDQK
ncbi:hypothetical protein ACM39_12680 [Chryseobacterium sp. FH2]|nr:hypothetical protein ACM39_12680 [Chryseobacterium sp. FH2]